MSETSGSYFRCGKRAHALSRPGEGIGSGVGIGSSGARASLTRWRASKLAEVVPLSFSDCSTCRRSKRADEAQSGLRCRERKSEGMADRVCKETERAARRAKLGRRDPRALPRFVGAFALGALLKQLGDLRPCPFLYRCAERTRV